MYLLEKRLSLLDSACIAAASILFARGELLWGVWVAILSAIIISVAETIYGQKAAAAKALAEQQAKDKQWQDLSRAGLRVDAIKRHRQLYGTSLKEALDVVDAYEGRPPR